MQTPLNASASTAGSLISGSIFEVPQFQREYSWHDDEVRDFWNDLKNNLDAESYFLGLVILTEENGAKYVVDGQQRIVTLTLLASVLYHQAIKWGRTALADRIQADFLSSINYETDEADPRVRLTDDADNETLQYLVKAGDTEKVSREETSVSSRMVRSFKLIKQFMIEDLTTDPFKRLGKWTEFLNQKLYFAVFVHPDSATAYQVFEVINTRGRDLTTADLLKNYVLSESAPKDRNIRYGQWQALAKSFPIEASSSFVQYIRHVITVQAGHILPKNLYSFLAGRTAASDKRPSVPELMQLLDEKLPLYSQMMDPTAAGPADQDTLRIFSALNALNVMSVRPLMLAVWENDRTGTGLDYILRLVVRRVIVGNLGTGNVERIFGDAAQRVHAERDWRVLEEELGALNPSKEDFVEQLTKRSFNKGTLAFIRNSIISERRAPEKYYTLHLIAPRGSEEWGSISEDARAFWCSTIGNTILADIDRRPKEAATWAGFQRSLLSYAVGGEWVHRISEYEEWDENAIERVGRELATAAGEIWYE